MLFLKKLPRCLRRTSEENAGALGERGLVLAVHNGAQLPMANSGWMVWLLPKKLPKGFRQKTASGRSTGFSDVEHRAGDGIETEASGLRLQNEIEI